MTKYLLFIFLALALFVISACTPKTEVKIKDFHDFTNLPNSNNKSAWDEAISTGIYEDRMYYNVFHELYYPGTRPDLECLENQETYECLYEYAILNNREDLCASFPEERQAQICSRPGCTYVTIHYRDSCIVYTRVYEDYINSQNKIAFCNSFSEGYIRDICKTYTCSSQFLKLEEIPEECE